MIVLQDDEVEERSSRWQVCAALGYGIFVALAFIAWVLAQIFWS